MRVFVYSCRLLIGASHDKNLFTPLPFCSPPPNLQGGGAAKATPIPPVCFPPPNEQGKGSGGAKVAPISPKSSPPPTVQGEGRGGGKAAPIAPTYSLPLNRQGKGGGGGKTNPDPPMCSPLPNEQGKSGSGSKSTPIAPMCSPPPIVQKAKFGIREADGNIKELTNLKAIREKKFKQCYREGAEVAMKVRDWAARHADELRGPVSGPIGLEVGWGSPCALRRALLSTRLIGC